MRIISVCLTIFLLPIFIVTNVFARTEYDFPKSTDGQINEALQRLVPVRFLIDNPLYIVSSFKESLTRFLAPSAVKKAEFDMILSGKKIKEAYLLVSVGDIKNTSRTLGLYKKRVEKMANQLEKARSQNQSVDALVDVMAENLRIHETLFFAIDTKRDSFEDAYSFDSNFDAAVAAHAKAVMVLDNIKPGIADRFTTTKNEATEEAKPMPSPFEKLIIEASPSVKPRRIIL